ncbi:MAG: hypothetical protein Q4D04_15900 [Clostridia bacterium]|nr:hypothetical protein [Clostridia bacterium]
MADFRKVSDWRSVEYNPHYVFREQAVKNVDGQRELFSVSIAQASLRLNELKPEEIVGKPKVDRMFADESFRDYLLKLFQFSGLYRWMNEQGIWTLTLFPSTAGGRFFTLNIAAHEVAFSTLPKNNRPQINMVYLDSLILDFSTTMNWVYEHDGFVEEDTYPSALEHGVTVMLSGDFEIMNEFMSQNGVRRAILAYWGESLIRRGEENRLSIHARHHDYNAVAALKKLMASGEKQRAL